jgi:hypothetical protein
VRDAAQLTHSPAKTLPGAVHGGLITDPSHGNVARPEDKVEIERLLSAVRNAVTDRKWQEVTQACNELSDVLFYLEDA